MWIGRKIDIDYDELVFDGDGVITDILGALIGSPTPKFKKYESTKQSAMFTEEGEIDDTQGSIGWNQNLTMRFSRQEKDKRNEMNFLASGDAVAIIEDMNGQFRLVGARGGLRPTELNTETGAALGEGNVYNVVLTSYESELAPFIDGKSVIADVVEDASIPS